MESHGAIIQFLLKGIISMNVGKLKYFALLLALPISFFSGYATASSTPPTHSFLINIDAENIKEYVDFLHLQLSNKIGGEFYEEDGALYFNYIKQGFSHFYI